MTAMLLASVFMGLLAGYSSARLYKVFKGSEWEKVTIKTATMFPRIVFATFFVLNALIWGERSSSAVLFTTMSALVLLWFGISSGERLLDNSYWTKGDADSGYGAKAQEIIGQVRGRVSRHEKTKMKRVGGAVHWSCCRRPLRPAALAFFDCDLSYRDALLLRLHVFRWHDWRRGGWKDRKRKLNSSSCETN